MKNWLIGIAAALTISLMGWVGVSNLQALTFQAAMAPQIESIALILKETQENIIDIQIYRTNFATKKAMWAEVKRLDQLIDELQLEAAELKLRATALEAENEKP